MQRPLLCTAWRRSSCAFPASQGNVNPASCVRIPNTRSQHHHKTPPERPNGPSRDSLTGCEWPRWGVPSHGDSCVGSPSPTPAHFPVFSPTQPPTPKPCLHARRAASKNVQLTSGAPQRGQPCPTRHQRPHKHSEPHATTHTQGSGRLLRPCYGPLQPIDASSRRGRAQPRPTPWGGWEGHGRCVSPIMRPGQTPSRTRTSSWAAAGGHACSSGPDGECGTRSESDGTWSPCPCGCAPSACARSRPAPTTTKQKGVTRRGGWHTRPGQQGEDGDTGPHHRGRTFLIRWYRSSGREGLRPLRFRTRRILLPVTLLTCTREQHRGGLP